MKVYYTSSSPFVRKVLVTGYELGFGERIEKLANSVNPINRDANIVALNPTGQVPTFIADDGEVLYDSRVICEYLDAQDGRHRIFPVAGPARWRALREQSMGDGLLDAALLARYESFFRPAEFRWQAWEDGQMAKIESSLQAIDKLAASFGDRFDIGPLTVACALGYLDFRFPTLGWRERHQSVAAWCKEVSARPSLQATVNVDPSVR